MCRAFYLGTLGLHLLLQGARPLAFGVLGASGAPVYQGLWRFDSSACSRCSKGHAGLESTYSVSDMGLEDLVSVHLCPLPLQGRA